jgi:hypothetical protein
MMIMGVAFWVKWGLLLFAQNASSTLASRARNSGSLLRHMIASFGSNGIWFVSLLFTTTTMVAIMTGHMGKHVAIASTVFYTVITMLGSISAHYLSMLTERGHSAVGARKNIAQIKTEDWEAAQYLLHQFRSRKTCDELVDMLVDYRKSHPEIVTSIPPLSFPNRRTGPTKEAKFSCQPNQK